MKRLEIFMTGIADSLILPIAGFLITGLLYFIGFGIRKMLTGIYSKLDSLGNDINQMNLESQMLRAEVSGLYKTLSARDNDNNYRFEKMETKLDLFERELHTCKNNVQIIMRHHYKHHPDDNIKID